MTEIWKQIKNQLIDIEVSNFGNVRGTKYNGKPFSDDMIFVNENGRKCLGNKQNPIYKLVWTLFCGIPPKGYDIHHIDHNKLNDSLENLELLEHGEHTRHHLTGSKWTKEMYEKQKNSQTGKHCGELNPMFGKHHTYEAKEKVSKANKGRKASEETKKKFSQQRIGKHWFNNGINETFCYECPDGFVKGRLPFSKETRKKSDAVLKTMELELDENSK